MSKLLVGVAVLAIGCADTSPPPVAPASAPPPAAAALAPPPPSVVPAAATSAPVAAAPLAPPRPPFPPPAFTPPIERTKKPGDGAWTPLVADPAGGPALLMRSTLHPDRVKPHVYVALVAIDLDRVAVRLVAGKKEPIAPNVPEERRPGVIAADDLPRLVAVMNGGFMTRHGKWGMAIGGDVFLPPRDEGCTVALMRDGSVRVATHTALASSLAQAIGWRQTPPCLVEQGKIHEALLGSEKPRRWGMNGSGGVDIRRSAVGLLPHGRTLIYALGEWVTPRQMAETMLAVGVEDAAQLDVNWSYTRFLLYGPPPAPGAPPEVTATLVPKIKHAPKQYVKKPAERDFFYLARKAR
jgi:hypothetical protein